MPLKPVLQMEQGGGCAGGGGGASRCARAVALREVAGQHFLGGPDGQVAAQDGVGEKGLFFVGFRAEEDFGVPDGDAPLGEPALDARGEFQQPHAVGDGGAALADFLGDVVLAEPEFLGKPLVGDGFFNRVEVFALNVFDEREFEHLLVPGFADDNGRFLEAELFGGAPAAFARDELVFAVAFAHDERLDDAMFADRLHEFQQAFSPEVGARLEGTCDDLAGRDFLHPLSGFRLGGGNAGLDEGSETFA